MVLLIYVILLCSFRINSLNCNSFNSDTCIREKCERDQSFTRRNQHFRARWIHLDLKFTINVANKNVAREFEEQLKNANP